MKRFFPILAILAATSVHAEVPEVRIARQFSMGYLQLNVIEHEKLIQKHAAELGIPEVKVTAYKFNGPAAMNDALLSDSIDLVSGSPQGLLTIWSRTRGTAGEVRAVSALSTLPFVLNTNDPSIKTIDDLVRCKKIAVPAVKVSAQAVTIQARRQEPTASRNLTVTISTRYRCRRRTAPLPCCPAALKSPAPSLCRHTCSSSSNTQPSIPC